MPLIRVVIPVYNRVDLIGAALESMQAQTLGDLEVVVADDGSTDGTPEAVRTYAAEDPRIQLLELSHAGVAEARNAAIARPGDHQYVAFLDSDDIWLPAHLERAVGVLHEFPDAAVYFSRVVVDDIADMWSPERLRAYCERNARPASVATALGAELYWLDSDIARRSFLLSEFHPQPSSVVMRVSAVGRDPWFRPDLKVLEDCELFVQLAADGSNYIFDEQLHVRVRRLGDNLSGIPDIFSARACWRLASALSYRKLSLALCRSREELEHVIDQIADAAYLLGQNCAERLDLAAARGAYLECVRHRVSYRAVKGLLASLLPVPLLRVLRGRSGAPAPDATPAK